MEKYFKNYKTSVPGLLILLALGGYLLGYIDKEKLEVAIGIFASLGFIGARDVSNEVNGN